ncbi:putative signal peptide protein [Puccinia sorghi]|uniref:Putative signal peptide protein n=1 Tax=Puccinia sorghi TaxID=27349 RepID=A0A0L6UQ73_9BASI|nr:putative signal peptide protein [Puccinia sorghi]
MAICTHCLTFWGGGVMLKAYQTLYQDKKSPWL